MVSLPSIQADTAQPRKNFDPARLAELSASIKKHGIMNPLIVESVPGGKYILVDGERRFRAAKNLKLTEVPVVVMKSQSETERLIQQFHLQEQHESWSATEKAVAVSKLADQLKMTARQVAETLSLPQRTISDYVSFSKLIDKGSFQTSEVPISYARGIVILRVFVRNQWMKHNKEFSLEDEENLERAVIRRIKSGDIRKMTDLNKVRDSVVSDYMSVRKFMDDEKISTAKLYLDSDAKVATHVRNGIYSVASANTHLNAALPTAAGLELLRANPKLVNELKKMQETIKHVLAAI